MRKRSTFLAALAAIGSTATLAAVAPVSAGPAHAAIPVLCPVILGNPSDDPVRITLGANFDFGSAGGLVNAEPAACGLLDWDLANGTITPRLTGSLYAKNAIGTQIRMRLVHRDVDGTVLNTTNGQTKLVATNDETEFPITLGAYSNPLTYQVDVELQQLINNVWTTQGSELEHIGSSTKAADAVRVLSTGFDVGTGVFANGAPAGSASLTWSLLNNTITPLLTGDLYMINAAGTQARVRLSYYDVHGNLLQRMAGQTRQPGTNALTVYPVNVTGYSNPEIFRVESEITVNVGGTWTPVGNLVTAYI